MPGLLNTLQGNDLTFLRMVANLWGVEINAPDPYTAIPILIEALSDGSLVEEMVGTLPAETRRALQTLLDNDGRLSWAVFTRRFGELRVMGASKRDRERPDLKPVSPTEMLWYRALIGKAFFNTTAEPQEFAYIPDELIDALLPLSSQDNPALGRPASPTESAQAIPADDDILEQATTLLAALRSGIPLTEVDTSLWKLPPAQLMPLLSAADLLDAAGMPQPEATRTFLEAPRGAALALLTAHWLESRTFNELRLLPGLKFEGSWVNDSHSTRHFLLNLLSHVPTGVWWGLNAFIAAIKEQTPDFQRPAGDYDSWFIRKEPGGAYLRGYITWDEVDGALLRFLLTGPLFALGILDLAAATENGAPAAFRFSAWADALWTGDAPTGLPVETAQIRLNSDGRLRLPVLTPRVARYQVARFCQWESQANGEFRYRITPASLERARQQGLRPAHLVGLFKKYAAPPLPPALLQSLERWEKSGVQATLTRPSLLRLASPDVLTALQRTRAARYLGEVLTPTTVIIRPGGEEAVLNALGEIGYLAEAKLDS